MHVSVAKRCQHVTSQRSSELIEAWLAGRSPQTVDAYRRDLSDFAAYVGVSDPAQAVESLLGESAGQANLIALRYRAALLDRGLSPATVNRKLAALRSMAKVARTVGLITFSLDVENVRSHPYRDTRGPGVDGYRTMLEALQGRQDAKGARDRAILHLLHDLGLRRAEVCSLDREHLDLSCGSVSVMGKGRRERVYLTLPAPTIIALGHWITFRGDAAGPLFMSIDKGNRLGGRLTGRGLHKVVSALGDAVGLTVCPHGMRHTAITEALDLTSGDVRAVARFSRHADIRVLQRYDDNRDDTAGEIAKMVSAQGQG